MHSPCFCSRSTFPQQTALDKLRVVMRVQHRPLGLIPVHHAPAVMPASPARFGVWPSQKPIARECVCVIC